MRLSVYTIFQMISTEPVLWFLCKSTILGLADNKRQLLNLFRLSVWNELGSNVFGKVSCLELSGDTGDSGSKIRIKNKSKLTAGFKAHHKMLLMG